MREVLQNIYIDTIEYNIITGGPINISIVKTDDRSLLVDAGVSESVCPEYRDKLEEMMDELGITYNKLDVLITHAHIDHVGLVPYLIEHGARILAYPQEIETGHRGLLPLLRDEHTREKVFRTVGLTLEGDATLYDEMWKYADDYLRIRDYSLDFNFTSFAIGDVLTYGKYNFDVVLLKGHTSGQVGLYDDQKSVFFCADHIMKQVSPIVGCYLGYDAYFGDYLDTMSRVKHDYAGAVFIPGHGPVFIDSQREADRIVLSYLDKASDIYDLLRNTGEAMTIRSIGTAVYGRDEKNPKKDQFASCILIWGKVHALCRHMEQQKLIVHEDRDGVTLWRALTE